MKILNGSDLADFIKERQAKQVRNLRQQWKIAPRLAIVSTTDDPVTDKYIQLKQAYGADILIDVDVYNISQPEVKGKLRQLGSDNSVHGIIVQLPLADPSETDDLLACIEPSKDVDGLSGHGNFTPATPTAIDWLLVGYGVELAGKKIAIVGHGRLVGAPLAELWHSQGRDITVIDEDTDISSDEFLEFDIIVTAVGQPGLIKSSQIKKGAVVVDAATSSDNGRLVGDLDDDVRQRDDLTITPERGGVGPLTVAALFDNVITAARRVADQS